MTDECIFCRIAQKEAPARIIYEDADYLSFLDKFPQSRGHIQFLPKKHYRWVWDMPDIGGFFTVAQKIIRGIIPVLGADHVTLSTLGHEVHHAHLWIVPVYGSAKVMQEGKRSLTSDSEKETVAEILRNALSAR